MEPQPVNLKLCLYGGKEATIEKSFNKSTTLESIQKFMRHEFNVAPDRETKLWIDSSVYTFKPNQNLATTNSAKMNNQSDSTGFSSPTTISSDVKENNGCIANDEITNSKTITNNGSNSVSPVKPHTIHPPISVSPINNSTTSSSLQGINNIQTSPNVITRQAAQSMNKQQQQQPIALPDSTTVLLFENNKTATTTNSKSTAILSTSDTINSNSSTTATKETSPAQTLFEVGVTDSSVVTLEVINNDGTWPSSRPRYGALTTRSSKTQPGLCGLSNMGNTCFMNAALQCLSNTPPLTNYILTDRFLADINTNNPLGMHGEIARTYAELIKVMWSGNNNSYMPREFKCAVSRFAPQFTGFAQQDCQELMAFLLDGLHEDLNRIKDKPYIEIKSDVERRPDEEVARESWENYKKRNDSIVVDTFHAMLKSTLVCPECKLVSVTFDPFCYLSLPLPVKREKQVNLTFLPAPAKIDFSRISTAMSALKPEDIKVITQYGGSISSFDGSVEKNAGCSYQNCRPMGCKIQVPRSGPASELCEIVARIINDERPAISSKIKQENLVVAELAIGRISKIYDSSEHYNQINDDIVVIEKASKHVLPLYLRERKDVASNPINYGMSKLLFLHVPDLKYETFYMSIIASLSNLVTDLKDDIITWCPLVAPTELPDEKMDCDDESELIVDPVKAGDGDDVEFKINGKGNGSITDACVDGNNSDFVVGKRARLAFELATVNSFGNHSFETLGPQSGECDNSSKLYLCATFSPDIASTSQFEHNRAPKNESVDTFTPKVSPKPTLQLKDCITQFTNAERLGADDPWYCPKCKKHQQAIKKFDIWSLPEVLIIHLKRFSFSRSWRDKIDTLVEFPVEGLDMSSYVHNPEQKKHESLTYNLIGVANHFGGLGGGHYTAYAKNAIQESWYSFDDAMVSPTSANNVVTRSAYCLFYQLQSSTSA